MIALLASAAPAEAGKGDGTAKYKYQVTSGSHYTGSGQLNATRGTRTCSPGFSASWMGGVTSEQAELSSLIPGKGSLKIGHNGTSGHVDATLDDVFSFNAQHTLIVQCILGVPFSAQPTRVLETTRSTNGRAAERSREGSAIGSRSSGRSPRPPSSLGGQSRARRFQCVDQFQFPRLEMQESKAKLNRFTRKHFKLDFECQGEELTAQPPLDTYTATADGSGSLFLRRKKSN